jgi:hypothetical protein
VEYRGAVLACQEIFCSLLLTPAFDILRNILRKKAQKRGQIYFRDFLFKIVLKANLLFSF